MADRRPVTPSPNNQQPHKYLLGEAMCSDPSVPCVCLLTLPSCKQDGYSLCRSLCCTVTNLVNILSSHAFLLYFNWLRQTHPFTGLSHCTLQSILQSEPHFPGLEKLETSIKVFSSNHS